MSTTGQHGVYKVVINSKKYIGSAVNLKYRKNVHLSKLKNKNHPNPHLQNAFNKYGLAEFTILEYVANKSMLLEREQYYIDLLNPEYNIRVKAESNQGLVLSSETKQKISKALKGIKRSDETKLKLKETKLGAKNPRYGKPALNRGKYQVAHNKGIPMSKESKIKASISAGKLTTQDVKEVKLMISKGNKLLTIAKLFNVDASSISNIKTGKHYSWVSIGEAV